MYTFTARVNEQVKEFKVKTVQGAKRKATSMFPDIQGTWQRHDGFTYYKSGINDTLYLLIPHSLT